MWWIIDHFESCDTWIKHYNSNIIIIIMIIIIIIIIIIIYNKA